LCPTLPRPTLCLAIGKIANVTDKSEFERHFEKHKWRLFDPEWALSSYQRRLTKDENDVAFVVFQVVVKKEGLIREVL
jgi:hypothetical protein